METEDTIQHYFYEEDFLVLCRFAEGRRPDYPWRMVFNTGSNPCYDYNASFDGAEYTNARPVAGTEDSVWVEFRRHRLKCGRLAYVFRRTVPNALFEDGKQDKATPILANIELWTKPSDDNPAPPEIACIVERAVKGADGHTPYVGSNDNWWIDGQDTGKPSRGPVPVKGIDYFTEEEVAEITRQAAAQVPLVDVVGPIAEHNASGSAHGDLRELLRGAVGLPVYDPASYALAFTTQSGATMVVDLPLEVMGLDFDPATKEMIYTAADGTKRRIPLAEFVDIYVGSVGAEIQIAVDAGNVIRARLLAGSVAMEHLSASLQAEIRGKVDRAKPMRLIQKITVAEEVTDRIRINVDAEGEPFRLKRVKILFDYPLMVSAQQNFDRTIWNQSPYAQIGKWALSCAMDQRKKTATTIRIHDTYAESCSNLSYANITFANLIQTQTHIAPDITFRWLSDFFIYVGNVQPYIPAGTIITIYGTDYE